MWNGRDTTGTIATGGHTFFLHEPPGDPGGYGLKNPFVIVRGVRPRIAGEGPIGGEVWSTPYAMYDTYDQVVRIRFSVDQRSRVTVRVLRPGTPNVAAPVATLLSDTVIEANAAQVLEWRGYDPGEARKLLSTSEGTYSFQIEAISESTGKKGTYLGAIQVFH